MCAVKSQFGPGLLRKTISRFGERGRCAKRKKGSEYFQIAAQSMVEGWRFLKFNGCCIEIGDIKIMLERVNK